MIPFSSYAENIYSQDGEDGMIENIFSIIGEGTRTCVEFGAGDGTSGSNTARLWRDKGWKALLVEPDPLRFQDLEANALPFGAVCIRAAVVPEGLESISSVLQEHQIPDVDFMSIDVDGDDYFIFEKLKCHPRVICIEFNPTIPPHLVVRQKEPMGCYAFGASLLALERLAASMGYSFVGATRCNAFFVRGEESNGFVNYERDIQKLFVPNEYTYAITDYSGRIVLCGQYPTWLPREPYVLPLEASGYVIQATDSIQQIRRGFESFWGPAVWLTPNGLSVEKLHMLLDRLPALICIDVTSSAEGTTDWIHKEIENLSYKALTVGKVLGLIREGT